MRRYAPLNHEHEAADGFVTLTGDQTVAGLKTFSEWTVAGGGLGVESSYMELSGATTGYGGFGMWFYDKTDATSAAWWGLEAHKGEVYLGGWRAGAPIKGLSILKDVASNVLTGMVYGNAADNPSHTFNGSVSWSGTLTGGTVPWARLSDVPATFAPSAHTHNASDVNAGVLAAARIAGTTHGHSAINAMVQFNRLSTVDLNDYLTSGVYGLGTTLTNAPTGNSYDPLLILRSPSDTGAQVVIPRTASRPIAYRGWSTSGASFTAWNYGLWGTSPDHGGRLTNLNATNLATGTVPDARLPASQAAKQFASIELGHATDTTLTRLAAGKLGVEGKGVLTHRNAYASGGITVSTSAPGTYTGIANGDIWLKV